VRKGREIISVLNFDGSSQEHRAGSRVGQHALRIDRALDLACSTMDESLSGGAFPRFSAATCRSPRHDRRRANANHAAYARDYASVSIERAIARPRMRDLGSPINALVIAKPLPTWLSHKTDPPTRERRKVGRKELDSRWGRGE